MSKTPDYVCSVCGAPIIRGKFCHHVKDLCPGFCTPPYGKGEGTKYIGRHDMCRGQAMARPLGSCPCSCHRPFVAATDKEVADAAQRLLNLQRELEEVNHAEM